MDPVPLAVQSMDKVKKKTEILSVTHRRQNSL
jgi:hypothetical protein